MMEPSQQQCPELALRTLLFLFLLRPLFFLYKHNINHPISSIWHAGHPHHRPCPMAGAYAADVVQGFRSSSDTAWNIFFAGDGSIFRICFLFVCCFLYFRFYDCAAVMVFNNQPISSVWNAVFLHHQSAADGLPGDRLLLWFLLHQNGIAIILRWWKICLKIRWKLWRRHDGGMAYFATRIFWDIRGEKCGIWIVDAGWCLFALL